MKMIVRLFVAITVLTFAMSTASLADGGSPPPMCSPGNCKTTTTIPS